MLNVNVIEVEELNFDEVVVDQDYFGFDRDVDATQYFKEAEPLMGNGLLEIEDGHCYVFGEWIFNRGPKMANGEGE